LSILHDFLLSLGFLLLVVGDGLHLGVELLHAGVDPVILHLELLLITLARAAANMATRENEIPS